MKTSKYLLLSGVTFFSAFALYAEDQTPNGHVLELDTVRSNLSVKSGAVLTASDQSNNEADLATTQKIRQELIKEKSLSTEAKNIKVITVNGKVTLRGPVVSESEKKKVCDVASDVAGKENVDDQLEVKTSK